MYQLASGKRLHQPRGCPREVYDVMLACWDKDARARPDFSALRVSLKEMLRREVGRGSVPRDLTLVFDECVSNWV